VLYRSVGVGPSARIVTIEESNMKIIHTMTALGLLLAAGCGSDGSNGKSGSQGPAGPAGPAGEIGADGTDGPAGPAGDGGTPPVTPSDVACDDIDLEPPAAGEGIQLSIAAFFSAYYESEQCKFIRVPDEGLNFNGQEMMYTVGSHHVNLHRTAFREIPTQLVDGTPFLAAEGEIFDCGAKRGGVNGMFGTTGVFAGSQNPEWAPPRFPADTAIKVEGGTYLILDAHFLNPTPEGLHTCSKLNLFTIPDAEVTREADIFFWYNPFLTVPAQGQSTMTATGTIPVDIEILGAVQSHMHSRGASYVAKLYGPSGTFIQNLFETTDWETPSPRDFAATPLLVQAGSTIEYSCNYTNTENRQVHQGLETSDEMCMFIGTYRPVNPADSTPELQSALYSLTSSAFFDLAQIGASGTASCAATVQCMIAKSCSEDSTQAGCDGDPDAGLSNPQQQCMTDSCYPTEALAYLRCAGANSATCASACQAQTAMPLYQSQCVTSCGSTQAQAVTACQATALLADHQAKCSTATPMAAYQANCAATTCATDCADAQSQACTDCMTGCVTGKVTACVTEKVTACVTEKVTACVTDCVVGKVTSCAQECLQTIECKTQWDACSAGTTCN
jgi:hypothetical protein